MIEYADPFWEENIMDIKEIKRLINLVEGADISHLSIEEDGVKIKIEKELRGSFASVVVPQQVAAPVAAPLAAESAASTQDSDEGLTPVKAQMVGTFYASSNPETPAFVKIGDSISNGQIVCIIEAMKLFNEIESEVQGVIEKVCVSNGDAVEFGQTLFLVR